MIFLEKSENLIKKLKQIQNLSKNTEEAKSLKNDAEKIEERNTDFDKLIILIKIAREKDIPFTPQINQKLNNQVNDLKEKFKQSPVRKTLTNRGLLESIIDGSKEVYRQNKSKIEDAWVLYRENNYPVEKPDELNANIAQTDENKRQLEEYKKVYHKIEPLLRNLPDNISVFNELDDLKQKLKDIMAKIDFNVPKEVKSFLNDISNNQGASLDYLANPIVLEWLKEHKQMDRYKIIRKY